MSAVRQAAAHTLTLHAAVSLEFVSPPAVPYPPIRATGAFDLQRGSGQELVHDTLGTETLVFLPTRIFDRRPVAASVGLPRGRPWIRVDFHEQLKRSKFLAQFLLRLQQRDPSFLLAVVAWGARGAAPLGPRTVDGVPTTGYRVHVDAARAVAAASGPGARVFLRKAALLKQELRHGMGAPRVVYLWVDRAHRVVSVRTATTGSEGGTTLMTLSSFGIPVRVSPPSLSQTVDLAALVGADTDNDGD